jgi:hypothetical protein
MKSVQFIGDKTRHKISVTNRSVINPGQKKESRSSP